MKTGLCLSIQQPWTWLIAHGNKDIENRTWPTGVRGWIGLHAGKRFDREGYDWVRSHFPAIPMPEPEDFERGGIVGRAYLANCTDDSNSQWFFGPYGFAFKYAEPLPFQACPGRLGFFRPDIELDRRAG